MTPSPILHPITPDDWPRIAGWLRADHVRAFWGEPEETLRALREATGKSGWQAMIEVEGVMVGLVLWQHPSREELDAAGLGDIPSSVMDIDLLIGEPSALARGIGSATLRQVATMALANTAVPYVIGCVRLDNRASQRAFFKAGFVPQRVFDDSDPAGRYVLMVRHRRGLTLA